MRIDWESKTPVLTQLGRLANLTIKHTLSARKEKHMMESEGKTVKPSRLKIRNLKRTAQIFQPSPGPRLLLYNSYIMCPQQDVSFVLCKHR